MPAGAFAAERSRPSLLVTRQDVTRAKELIATCPWAADVYRDVCVAAEQRNTVAQGLVYQIDGNRQSADRAKASLVAAGSTFRPGGPYHWGVGVNEAITYDLVAETCTAAERRQIMLFANGRLIYPSWLCQQYEPVGCAPQRHNKVVVDKRPNTNQGKSRQRYEFSSEVKFLTNTCTGLNVGVTEVRSLFVTDQYVADFYDLKSDRQHTYDWFLHGIGNLGLVEAPLYKPSRDFAVDYPWIEHERRWETDSAVRADFLQRDGGVIRGIGRWSDLWFDGFAGVRLTLLGEPGTSVHGGDDPFSAPEIDWGRQRSESQTSIAAFCARRVAKNTTFAALHEPYTKAARLSVRRFGRERDTEAMLIAGPEFVDVVCTALGDGETLHTVRDIRDPAQTVRFRNYAWIRVADGNLHARGSIEAFVLCTPDEDEVVVMLNGKKVTCAKSGGYLVYPEGVSQNAGLVASAENDDVPRRVGPGESFPLKVRLANHGTTDQPRQRLRLVVPENWRAEPAQTDTGLRSGATATVEFTVVVPTTATVGSTHEMKLAVDGPAAKEPLILPVGTVAVTPPLVLTFDAESVRMATGTKRSVRLAVTNPTDSTVRGRVRMTGLTHTKLELEEIEVPPIPPDGKHTFNLTLLGGNRNELGEFWREVSGPGDYRCIHGANPDCRPKRMTWSGTA